MTMASPIHTNVATLTAQRHLSSSQALVGISVGRLSSGLRINSAKDDAAGLAISERFRSQIRGANQGIRNANDGISLVQTAEGALKTSSAILLRVRELAVQSANATHSAADRQALQQEVSQLVAELDRISQTAQFNRAKLLDGSFAAQQFQVGPNADQSIKATMPNLRTSAYGVHVNSPVDGAGPGVNGQWIASTPTPVNAVTQGVVAIQGHLGSANVSVAAAATAKETAQSINAVQGSTGVTATAITEARLYDMNNTGTYRFFLESDNAGSPVNITLRSRPLPAATATPPWWPQSTHRLPEPESRHR